MCDNGNKEDTVVYHSAKVGGVDLFEDDDTHDLLAWNGTPISKTHLKPF